MTSRLNPYISFKDDAREAMQFYRDVFGGELTLSTFGEGSGMVFLQRPMSLALIVIIVAVLALPRVLRVMSARKMQPA